MFDFITLSDYPAQTLVHWAQGLLVGFLLVQAHFKQHWHLIGYAAIATICFISYESLEQVRISDRGDIDVLNFALMVHISAVLTAIYHLLRRKYGKP